MPRKSQYDQLRDAVIERLHQLDHTQAKTVEEAVANEQVVCNAFGMAPSGAEAYDYCPSHPTTGSVSEPVPPLRLAQK
jgi:hypothetical protein